MLFSSIFSYPTDLTLLLSFLLLILTLLNPYNRPKTSKISFSQYIFLARISHHSCQSTYNMSYLLFSLITFSFHLSLTNSQALSPFDQSAYYSPTGLTRLSYSSTLTGTISDFIVSLTATQSSPPHVVCSISSLNFGRGVKYDLSLTAVTNSVINARITYDSNLSKASFLFLVVNSAYLTISLTYFTYNAPNPMDSSQTFQIVDNDKHHASFLVGLEIVIGPFPSGYSLLADSQILDNPASTVITGTLSVTYDPSQAAVKYAKVCFVDINVMSFRAKAYQSLGQMLAIYGSNGFATDVTFTGTYVSSYPSNYMSGLQMLFDIQFMQSSHSFDIAAMLNTNCFYYISELLIVVFRCPGAFPFTDNDRKYCYSSCEIRYYGDDQMICRPCDANCFTCFNTSTNCTSCVAPYELVYGFRCGCNDQSYEVAFSNGTLVCVLCSDYVQGCYSCLSNTQCTSCMNNLVLSSPVLCSCPGSTIMRVIGRNVFCVEASLVANQACRNGLIEDQATCICPQSRNVSFSGGVCS